MTELQAHRNLIASIHKKLVGTDLIVSSFIESIVHDAGHDYTASELCRGDLTMFWNGAPLHKGDALAFVFGETSCYYAAHLPHIANDMLVRWIAVLSFLSELAASGHGEMSLYYEQILDCIAVSRDRLGAECGYFLARMLCR
jgi:hypothetical protein